jgi:transcriptional regulator with XRE-family HTH domain
VNTINTPQHHALVKLLVAARKASGLRQQDIAKGVKRSQQWIAHIESGRRRIDVVEYLELTEAIGCDPFKLLAKISRTKG